MNQVLSGPTLLAENVKRLGWMSVAMQPFGGGWSSRMGPIPYPLSYLGIDTYDTERLRERSVPKLDFTGFPGNASLPSGDHIIFVVAN